MPTPEFVLDLRRHVGHALLPLVGVTAVVRDDAGRLLLGLRSDTRDWALPSGIVEPGEEPAVAVVREVGEDHPGAVLRERARHREADALRAPRDEGASSVEKFHEGLRWGWAWT